MSRSPISVLATWWPEARSRLRSVRRSGRSSEPVNTSRLSSWECAQWRERRRVRRGGASFAALCAIATIQASCCAVPTGRGAEGGCQSGVAVCSAEVRLVPLAGFTSAEMETELPRLEAYLWNHARILLFVGGGLGHYGASVAADRWAEAVDLARRGGFERFLMSEEQ